MYPNLAELIKYHPYHIRTFAKFADVSDDLLEAVLRGEEELMAWELRGISQYAGVPYGVLACPKVVTMHKGNSKHCKMMEELDKALYRIWEAQKAGSKNAEMYMRYGRTRLVKLLLNFQNDGKVTYCRYLGALEEAMQTLSWIKLEKHQPRTIRKKTA